VTSPLRLPSEIMPTDWPMLLSLAEAEVKKILHSLPRDLGVAAERVPVSFEMRPNTALQADGIEADTLGLFVGESFAETGESSEPLPPQIILFLENLWETADEDAPLYRTEVRTTFLHELGHYLGLDEIDLEERGLE
jgi:predicted Zn-dependent protease with MMP-like domain